MTGWHPDSRGVTPGGDCGGGDRQAGDAYEVRFRNDQIPYGLIIVSVYPEASGRTPDGSPWRVATKTTHMACDDPENPGGSERWSVCRYTTASHPYRTLPAAVKAAGYVAEAYAMGSMMPDLTGWHGETFRLAS